MLLLQPLYAPNIMGSFQQPRLCRAKHNGNNVQWHSESDIVRRITDIVCMRDNNHTYSNLYSNVTTKSANFTKFFWEYNWACTSTILLVGNRPLPNSQVFESSSSSMAQLLGHRTQLQLLEPCDEAEFANQPPRLGPTARHVPSTALVL